MLFVNVTVPTLVYFQVRLLVYFAGLCQMLEDKQRNLIDPHVALHLDTARHAGRQPFQQSVFVSFAAFALSPNTRAENTLYCRGAMHRTAKMCALLTDGSAIKTCAGIVNIEGAYLSTDF